MKPLRRRGIKRRESLFGSKSDIQARKAVGKVSNERYFWLMLTQQQMVMAMNSSDRRFDGQFYIGVHSTGIYCLPSCRARKPLLKNVRFYVTREEALAAGLRACRRCRPERYPDTLPQWSKNLLAYLNSHQYERLTERSLETAAGVNAKTLRRYFRERMGMTPLKFSRYHRLLFAKRLIVQGHSALEAAYECGYQSTSGFRDAFIKQFGYSPGESRARENH